MDQNVSRIAKEANAKGQIVIYDSTHYLGEREIEADYVFCSYRKWFFCNYALARKLSGKWSVTSPDVQAERYISLRNEAADLKEKYINGQFDDKQQFLRMFAEAEESLETDYVNHCGEKILFNRDKIIQSRQKNARRLVEGIKGIEEIKVWKRNISEFDTPLFVPILVSSKIRNELRKYLIQHDIYCPIHWPLTDMHGKYKYREIFDNELSLICDQRYSAEDIDREIEVIKDFFKREI